MNNQISKNIYWTPRVLSIVFLLFLSLFSLDVITPESSIGNIILGLIFHNVPVFILAILLFVAWRYEIVGAIAYFLAGLLYIGILVMNIINGNGGWYMLSWAVFISGPAFIIGYLFWLGWQKKKIFK